MAGRHTTDMLGEHIHESAKIQMNPALYDSFIGDYYDESPVVRQRLQDVAFYRDAARDFGDPILELRCGTGRITMALAEARKGVTGVGLFVRLVEGGGKQRVALRHDARDS